VARKCRAGHCGLSGVDRERIVRSARQWRDANVLHRDDDGEVISSTIEYKSDRTPPPGVVWKNDEQYLGSTSPQACVAIDCSNLVHIIYTNSGLSYEYATTRDMHSDSAKYGFLKTTSPKDGDIVLISGHMGVITDVTNTLWVNSGRHGPVENNYMKNWWGPDRVFLTYDKSINKRNRMIMRMFSIYQKPLCISFIILSISFNTAFASNDGSSQYYSPEQTVRAFVELDGLDILYTTYGWRFIELLTTWQDAPGWDEIIVIKDYQIKTILKNRDIATIDVTYNVIGRLDYTGSITKTEPYETIRIKLKRDSEKKIWKIHEPFPFPPHIFSKYCSDISEGKCSKSNYGSKISK